MVRKKATSIVVRPKVANCGAHPIFNAERTRLQPPDLSFLGEPFAGTPSGKMVIRCFKVLFQLFQYSLKKVHDLSFVKLYWLFWRSLNKGVFSFWFFCFFGLRKCGYHFCSQATPSPATADAPQVFHPWVNLCLRSWMAMSRPSTSHFRFSSATLLPPVPSKNWDFHWKNLKNGVFF